MSAGPVARGHIPSLLASCACVCSRMSLQVMSSGFRDILTVRNNGNSNDFLEWPLVAMWSVRLHK